MSSRASTGKPPQVGHGHGHGSGHGHGHGPSSGHGKGPKLPPPYHLGPKARGTTIVSCLLTWLATLAMCLTVVAAGQALDALLRAQEWAGRSLTPASSVRVEFTEVTPMESLPASAVTMLIVGPLVVWAALAGRAIVQARGQIREEHLVRHAIVNGVFTKGPAAQSTTKGGSVVSLATEGAEKMMQLRQGFIAEVIASLTGPLLVIAVMGFAVDWLVALIMLAFLPVVPGLVWLFRTIVSKVSTGSQDARKDLAAAYMDALQSLTSLRLLGAAGCVGDRLEEVGERNRVAIMKLLKGNQLILFVMDAAFSLALVTVAAALALWRMDAGVITPGQALALVGLSILLLEPMDQVGAFFYVGMGGLGSQRGIYGFLRGVASFTSTGQAPGTPSDDSVVQLHGVHFAYDQDKPVLHGATLTVQQGERVALVGPSGQGKSTVLDIIRGELHPQEGDVKVGEEAASVNQHTWLFTGTIADNLRLAKENATEAEMWDALERAHVAEEIRQFPDGLATQVGERGAGLSGGQAQRIALARAFVSGRKLLLLDEPTSHVDLGSEREILAAINAIGREYTLIMVTHREASLAHMDRVLTVRGGKIEEA